MNKPFKTRLGEVGTFFASPPGWRVVGEEWSRAALQRLNPFHRPTEAGVVMRDWRAGSRVVKVETEGGEDVEPGILPGGDVAGP